MLTKDGEVPNMDKAMLADAIATTTGAICGTSTVTTFVESSSGVAEGGRTGLSSMVTALMFLVAMFLSPVAQLVPGCATAAALIYALPANIGHETSNVTLSLHRALRPLQNISVKMDIQLGLEQKQQLLQLQIAAAAFPLNPRKIARK